MTPLNDEHYLLICFSFFPTSMNNLHEVKESCLTYPYILVIGCCSVSQSCLTLSDLWCHGLQHARPLCPSDQISRSVMSDSLRPHESQHARPPCSSPTPGVHWDSCPLSQWCHPAISSSVSPSLPAPNPSQHQGLFQWVNSSHEVDKVLEFQL